MVYEGSLICFENSCMTMRCSHGDTNLFNGDPMHIFAAPAVRPAPRLRPSAIPRPVRMMAAVPSTPRVRLSGIPRPIRMLSSGVRPVPPSPMPRMVPPTLPRLVERILAPVIRMRPVQPLPPPVPIPTHVLNMELSPSPPTSPTPAPSPAAPSSPTAEPDSPPAAAAAASPRRGKFYFCKVIVIIDQEVYTRLHC